MVHCIHILLVEEWNEPLPTPARPRPLPLINPPYPVCSYAQPPSDCTARSTIDRSLTNGLEWVGMAMQVQAVIITRAEETVVMGGWPGENRYEY